MKVAYARVVENTRLYGDTYIMWLDCDDLLRGATAGQFLMLRCADPSSGSGRSPTDGSERSSTADGELPNDPLLGRAMSYHRIRAGENGQEFAILYDVVGRGTAWLARREPGDQVFGWGPLGRGYSLRGAGQNPSTGSAQALLLVGGGIGIAPLLWLADEAVSKGKSVVLIHGARNADGVFPAHLVPSEVEVVVTTEDGSQGRKGRVTDVFAEYFGWADQVFTCGPNPMFAALAETLLKIEGGQRTRRRKPVQALLESPMACGTGICYGCVVFDRREEPRLVCKDGPRFELRDIWG